MCDEFKIFVLRLRDGQKEIIEENLSPEFLKIEEEDLAFNVPVSIKGEAELADTTLVIRLAVKTEATMPCSICNKKIQVKMSIPDFCHTVESAEIKSGVYNFKEVLRDAILIELPPRAECHDGACPERKVLSKYFSRS